MENSFLENKIVLKYCKDYYRIINEELSDYDYMTDKIIGVYQSYIFDINIRDKDDIKSIIDLNAAVSRYIDDREFKTVLNKSLSSLKVSKKETNIILYIAKNIIKEYEKYMEGYTRNLYIPRWI